MSVEFLLTGEGKEKAPSDTGEGEISEGRLKAAFFRGADPTLTDEEIDALYLAIHFPMPQNIKICKRICR